MIMHMPVGFAPTGADFVVSAQMGDPMTPIDQINAELYYVIGDGTPADNLIGDYTRIFGVPQTNGFFDFTVPQAIVDASTANGLYYFLKVITAGGSAFMSASPEADMAGNEDLVSQAPFIVNCGAIGTTYSPVW